MNDTTDASPPPPAPPSPSDGQPRRVLRRSEDRMVAGVAAGLADHLGIDVAIVRILFVVTALFSGIGLVAYLLLWLFVPAADGTTGTDELARAVDRTPRREAGFWVGIGLLVLGAVWLASMLGGAFMAWPGRPPIGFFNGGMLVPLVLIGIGVALWRSSASEPPLPPGSAATGATTATGATGASAATGASPATGAGGTRPASDHEADTTTGLRPAAPPAPVASAPVWTPPADDREPRSTLGRVTFALALLASGGLWLASQLRILPVRPLHILAVALLIIGMGLIVGAWFGRARWLILVGVLLAPMVLVAAVLGPVIGPLGTSLRGPIGSHSAIVPAGSPVAPTYEFAVGEFRLDLRGARVADEAFSNIWMGAGELVVWVPDDVDLVVDARLGFGELDLLGQAVVGPGLQLSLDERDQLHSGGPVLHLDIRGGVGVLKVQRTTLREPQTVEPPPQSLRSPPADARVLAALEVIR